MRKRYLAEGVGTFVIVLAPVLYAGSGDGSLLSAAIVSGLAVLAMIYALGPISAAHFNPAVTLGFAVSGRFPWRHVGLYWLAQVLGAVAAGVVGFAIVGRAAGYHVPLDPSAVGRNVLVEAIAGFVLMLVISAVATDKRIPNSVPGVAIGMAVILGVLVAGPITGGSMNPARSLGPALFDLKALNVWWIYALGPCLGAVLGALTYEAIRLDSTHAVGVLAES